MSLVETSTTEGGKRCVVFNGIFIDIKLQTIFKERIYIKKIKIF